MLEKKMKYPSCFNPFVSIYRMRNVSYSPLLLYCTHYPGLSRLETVRVMPVVVSSFTTSLTLSSELWAPGHILVIKLNIISASDNQRHFRHPINSKKEKTIFYAIYPSRPNLCLHYSFLSRCYNFLFSPAETKSI